MARWWSGALVATLVLCADPLWAKDTLPDVSGDPDSRIRAALSPEALSQFSDARVIAHCKVSAQGALSDCSILSETPAGLGFGKAVLAQVPTLRAVPATHDGKRVDSELSFSWDGAPKPDKDTNWLRRPTPEDLLVVWPKEAWRSGLGGIARINCVVTSQGRLQDCFVEAESPPGAHFGSAALLLSAQFAFRPATKDGHPVRTGARIPVNFVLPDGQRAGPQSLPFGSRSIVSAAIAWTDAPSISDVASAYPKVAKAAKVGGQVTLDCVIQKDRHLHNCHTLLEAPRGKEFASAALKLSEKFVAPEAVQSTPSAGMDVQVPIAFDPQMVASPSPILGKPQWAALPDVADVQSAFANVKAPAGTVRIVLGCRVQGGGTLGECRVVSEQPSGFGLGPAALALAAKARLTTWSSEGLPTVGAEVNVPIRYEQSSAAPAPVPQQKQ
jgi:TonB family protein